MDNEVKKEGNVQEVEETQANLAESEKVLERFLEVLSEMNQQTVEMLQTGDLSTLYDMNDTLEEFCRNQMGNMENFYQGIQVEAQIIYENFDKMVNLANRVKQGKWTKNQSATVYDCLQNILAANITILKRYGLIK